MLQDIVENLSGGELLSAALGLNLLMWLTLVEATKALVS